MLTASLVYSVPSLSSSVGPLLWLVGACLAASLALAVSSVRVVPAHERAVILRLGRVARLRGPGVVILLPGVERMVRVSLRHSRVEPLIARTNSHDGVAVWVRASAHFHVTDPVRATVALANADAHIAEVLEAALRSNIEGTDLGDLTRGMSQRTERIVSDANTALRDCGVEVSDFGVDDIEVQLTSQLLHWAESLSGGHRFANIGSAEPPHPAPRPPPATEA